MPAFIAHYRRWSRNFIFALSWLWPLTALHSQSINPADVAALRQRYLNEKAACRDLSARVNQIVKTPVGQGWDGYNPTEWYFAGDLAYAAGCGSTNTDRLRQALDYAESHNIDNWWEIEIGVPRALVNGLFRGGKALPSEVRGRMESALRNFVSRQSLGEWNGANTVWRAWVRLAAGLYFDDLRLLQEAVQLFATATSQGDYSHIQHDWAYFFHFDVMNMQYGAHHYAEFAEYLKFSEGTSLSVEHWPNTFLPGQNGVMVFGQWFHHWIRWITYQGIIDPYTIAKLPNTWHYGKIDDGTQSMMGTGYSQMSPYYTEFQQILNRAPDPLGARSYPTGRYLVVRRPQFFAGLQLLDLVTPHKEASSFAPIFGAINLLTPQTIDRVEKYSVLNKPFVLLNTMTLPSRFTSDVAVPGSESSNRAHLSEITAMAKQWGYYGVSTLGGYYGIAGENLRGERDSFAFKKSWFFFDDEIVSLASDIYGSGTVGDIYTWINAFKTSSGSFATDVGAKSIPTASGAKSNLGNLAWVYHDNMGYVFPNRETILAEGLGESHSRLYLNHGSSPQNTRSVVVLLPNAELAEVQNYSGLEIVKHDGAAHVVRDISSGVVGAAFFDPAQSNLVNANLPAYILYQASSNKFRFSLHNPHKEAAKPIRLEHEGDPVNPMVDYDLKPEQATYHDYVIEVPVKLTKGSDPSLSKFALRNLATNRSEISVRLRVYRKLELEGTANADGSYTITNASIALNDAALPENSSPPVPTNVRPVAKPNGPYSGVVGKAIAFDGSASYDPDGGSIASYNWDFGDGATASGARVTHSYVTWGNYNGSLRVVDDEGSQHTAGFTVTITPADTVHKITVRVSADDAYELYINGRYVGENASWEAAEEYIAPLITGKNVIAIKAINDAQSVAGLVAEIQAQTQVWVSNSTWKVTRTEQANWEQPGFNDQDWAAATSFGAHGQAQAWAQFTNVSGISTDRGVQWIWSSDNFNHPVVYLRFTFGDGDKQPPSPPQGLQVR